MKIKKLLSVVLAFLLCLGSLSINASAEGVEDDSDFVDTPTLPPLEEVEVSVVFRPLLSWVSIAGFGPLLEGTILEIKYADGTDELITLEKAENEPWNYTAGDYYIYCNMFDTMEIKSPGINQKTIFVDAVKNDINYSGRCNDIFYLYIPSPVEWFYLLKSLLIIFF